MRRSENTRILENYEQCRDHITQTLEESPCRKNLLALAEWIYQLHKQCPQATKASSYVTGSKKDIRFYFGKQGIDHFLCVVPKKTQRCAELHVYGEDGRKSDFCKEKVQPNNPKSPFCIIDPEQVNSMSLQVIKEEVFRAYQARLREKYGIHVDQASVFPIGNVTTASQVNLSQKCYQPTIQDADAALNILAPDGEEIPTTHIRDYIQLDANRKGITLCSGWWETLEPQL